MNFKIQVVYDAGPTSRFRKLASKLEIGKLAYITGFLDLNDNELPFVEAKEIDLLDEFISDQSLISKSPFSRISKFRSNKNVFIKKEQTDSNLVGVTSKNSDNEKEDEIIEESELSDYKDNENSKKADEDRKKQELMDLSTRRPKRGRSAYKKDNDEVNEIIDVETNEPPKKRPGRKKNRPN